VMSTSETLNNLWFLHCSNFITTLATSNVKCVTLRVRECADNIKTHPRSIMISGTEKSILIRTHSTKIVYQLNHKGFYKSHILFPLPRDILLARDSMDGIIISSSTSFAPSTFYSYRNTSFMCD
jgi:hypothetical protein